MASAFQCDAFQQSAFQNDCGAAPVAAEAPSGGWFREPKPRGDSDTDREARIKAERIRMGIIPPDPPILDAGDITSSANSDITNSDTASGIKPYSLAAHLLPEDLAGLEALAARAAELTIDEEIEAWLGLQRLEEQRRLCEQDEDDAAVLLLAIATLH